MSRRPSTDPWRAWPDASVSCDGGRGSVCHPYRTIRAPSGVASSLPEPSSTTAAPSTDTWIRAVGPAGSCSSQTNGSDRPEAHAPTISLRPAPSGTITRNAFPSICTGALTSSPLTEIATSPQVEVPVRASCHVNASLPSVSNRTGPAAVEADADAVVDAGCDGEDVSLTADVHAPTKRATRPAAAIRRRLRDVALARTTPSTPRARCPGRTVSGR